jgi:membrane-bound ClpP family serine protease
MARSRSRLSLALRAVAIAMCALALVFSGKAQETAPTPVTAPAGERPAHPAPTQTAPPAFTPPAYRLAKNVAVITIRGEIDAGGRTSESVMVQSVKRRIDTAVRSGADAIVFEIDSPGGEVGATLRITRLIKECPIKNTVAWVHPQALSGGAIIALSCREIVVGESVTFGDAMPIEFGPHGPSSIRDPEMLRKLLPPLIADVVESARRHNEAMGSYRRDEFLSQAIIANDVELWWARNTTSGVEMAIDRREFELLFPGANTQGPTQLPRLPGSPSAPVRAESLEGRPPTDELPGVPSGSSRLAVAREGAESASSAGSYALAVPTMRPTITNDDAGKWELLGKILDGSAPATFTSTELARYNIAANAVKGADGRVALQPIASDEDLRAFFDARHVRRLESNWSEGLVLILTSNWVRGLLIAIFLVSLFIEMSHPGATIPGVVSVLALVALVAPPALIGMASWWEIGAILIGIVLLVVEAFFLPGFGVPGVLGLALLFAGLMGTFLPAGSGLFPSGERDQARMLWGLTTIVGAITISGIAMYFLAKHLGSMPVLNRFVLRDPSTDEDNSAFITAQGEDLAPAKVGERGVALTPLRPSGRVEIDGRVIDASAEVGYISPGQRVRIVTVDGIRVGVEIDNR